MSVWFIGAAVVGIIAAVFGVLLVRGWKSRFEDPDAEDRVRSLLWSTGSAVSVAVVLLGLGFLFASPRSRQSTPLPSPAPIHQNVFPALPTGNLIAFTYPRLGTGAINRNSALVVSLKKAVNPISVFAGDRVKDDAFFLREKTSGKRVELSVTLSPDQTVLVFKPKTLLGDPATLTTYEAVVGTGLLTSDGQPVANPPLRWEIFVGKDQDHEAPSVLATFPRSGTSAKNVIAQLTFSQPINPLSVLFGAAKIETQGKNVSLSIALSNDLHTLEIIGTNPCGNNTCGVPMWCFDGLTTYTLTLPAVEDLAGNRAKAAVTAQWKTSNELEGVTPHVVSVEPKLNASGVARDTPVLATFSIPMSATHLPSGSVALPADWVELSMRNIGLTSKLFVAHAPFSETTIPIESVLTSELRSIYQQCYQPCIGP